MTNKFLVGCVAFTVIYIIVAFSNIIKLGKNFTNSLDYNWFVASSLYTPKVGDLVAFYPYPTPVVNGDIIFVKKILGTKGDKVIVDGQKVTVRNITLTAKEQSKQGRKLQVINSKIIPNNYIFVYSNHRDSYDSRYAEIGLINKQQIIGKAWGF